MITCIYASTIGNTEATIEKIASNLDKNGYTTQKYRVEKIVNLKELLEQNNMFIFATSTWRHGDINPLWEKYLPEYNTMDFKDKYAGFVGCGDFRYEPLYFCRGIDILKDNFVKNGGTQVHMTLKVNGDPYQHFDKLIKVWTDGFIQELKKYEIK